MQRPRNLLALLTLTLPTVQDSAAQSYTYSAHAPSFLSHGIVCGERGTTEKNTLELRTIMASVEACRDLAYDFKSVSSYSFAATDNRTCELYRDEVRNMNWRSTFAGGSLYWDKRCFTRTPVKPISSSDQCEEEADRPCTDDEKEKLLQLKKRTQKVPILVPEYAMPCYGQTYFRGINLTPLEYTCGNPMYGACACIDFEGSYDTGYCLSEWQAVCRNPCNTSADCDRGEFCALNTECGRSCARFEASCKNYSDGKKHKFKRNLRPVSGKRMVAERIEEA